MHIQHIQGCRKNGKKVGIFVFTYCLTNSYDEKKTYSDYEFNGDLEEMRDLSQQYKQLEESKVQKRDRIRDEYNELSMSIYEKEKNNGIKY